IACKQSRTASLPLDLSPQYSLPVTHLARRNQQAPTLLCDPCNLHKPRRSSKGVLSRKGFFGRSGFGWACSTSMRSLSTPDRTTLDDHLHFRPIDLGQEVAELVAGFQELLEGLDLMDHSSGLEVCHGVELELDGHFAAVSLRWTPLSRPKSSDSSLL